MESNKARVYSFEMIDRKIKFLRKQNSQYKLPWDLFFSAFLFKNKHQNFEKHVEQNKYVFI